MRNIRVANECRKEILDLLLELKGYDKDSKEYNECLARIKDLNMIAKDQGIDPTALLGYLTNIVGIIAILRYEQIHVITSKAIGFVRRVA